MVFDHILTGADLIKNYFSSRRCWSILKQDGPSSGVKLGLKWVLEKTLPLSRPSELLTQAPLEPFVPWHPWHLLSSETFGTVLYCTVLYCTVPYCTTLYCTLLYHTVTFLDDTHLLIKLFMLCPLDKSLVGGWWWHCNYSFKLQGPGKT